MVFILEIMSPSTLLVIAIIAALFFAFVASVLFFSVPNEPTANVVEINHFLMALGDRLSEPDKVIVFND